MPQRLLIIGGTRFVGRHLSEAALAAGHTVTLFNRGQSGEPLPGAEFIQGDRRGDLSALAARRWDAVIDCCGYLPGEVVAMAQALRGRVDRYIFISSVSAYADFRQPNSEDSPLGVLADPNTTTVDGDTYGPLKAACEQVVRRVFGEQALLIRPGLVVGPHDPTGRFTWWPARVANSADGEPLLAPGHPEDELQFIDARDLAAFVLHAVAQGESGAFNVATLPGVHQFGDLLQRCAEAAGTSPQVCWASSAWLLAQQVSPWDQMPLWLGDDPGYVAFQRNNTLRAHDAGLRCRPLGETVADTLAWWRALPAEQQGFPKTGLSLERERELLSLLTTVQAS
ncbi:MAG TPA: NAD-dependent epimerase/dehydratase family protein [Ideonella sp.]|uniref:NAD-dependent epimerase/dehydratase family protein n=1 Tax=Ideonella sp. TaxID=1929293 RepID=UPI002CF1C906|nr:NAD-dependent epimerase/dehydratase family protein [Ideonella sp.]HSI49359.1 NAD-dependent epimerase/dehydratase family protein [Ideonella sp.]